MAHVTVNCSPASGSTFPVGSNTVSCTATDSHGNTATGSFKVNVSYAWNGFFKPVDMAPTAQQFQGWQRGTAEVQPRRQPGHVDHGGGLSEIGADVLRRRDRGPADRKR